MTDRFSTLVSGTRFDKFAFVGAVGAVFDLSLSNLFIVFFGVTNELAKLVGAELVIVVMFVISDRWTFAGTGSDLFTTKIRRFMKSNLVRSGGLLVQVLVVRALGEVSLSIPVADIDLWELIPPPFAIDASTLLSHAAESLFIWRITTRSSQRDSQ